ncbi:Uncharacterised protein [Enterococcus durans]|uniref:PqqD family protein n=1 Tax=Enterococcus durans TaxID=53345 RepID=A0A377KL55_9ENTE|nr:hypothetical protein [Enterococcus durans]STP29927.1 Uncharacterised protein [Enterococcus durans]
MLAINNKTTYDIRKNSIIISNGQDGFKLDDLVSITLFKEIVGKKKCSKKELISLTLSRFNLDEKQLSTVEQEVSNFISQLVAVNILEVI